MPKYNKQTNININKHRNLLNKKFTKYKPSNKIIYNSTQKQNNNKFRILNKSILIQLESTKNKNKFKVKLKETLQQLVINDIKNER